MATKEMKSAHEWLQDPRVQNEPGMTIYIYDADGWRQGDDVTMDTPISLEEFLKRLEQCSIYTRPNNDA